MSDLEAGASDVSYAALVLSVVMVGALHAVLTHETDLGWFDPTLHLLFLGIIGRVQWKRRWQPKYRVQEQN